MHSISLAFKQISDVYVYTAVMEKAVRSLISGQQRVSDQPRLTSLEQLHFQVSDPQRMRLHSSLNN